MPLKLYNTLTRRKEDFVPLDPGNVRIYVCGPTVYDYAHIGNARPVIVFDVLFRLLRHIYGESHVTYVRNITDVDDKINARAREEGVPIRDLTERTARQFHEDIAALGVLPPTHEPRATEYISPMIELIEKLIAKGHAYAADGHVLFDVTSTKDYGRLSRRSLDEMIAGARVDVAPYKKGDMDFVLWKPSDAATPGWDSPWGRGRPGWHIECSAMSWKHLGETFDIHGGGIDLLFPHHENELAQTRCAFGHKMMANIWMHNGFLQAEGQKMSKSLGNFVTINELLKDWSGETVRLAMLLTQYREPINWTYAQLEQAERELSHWSGGQDFHNEAHLIAIERQRGALHLELPDEFLGALEDDLNTPAALTVIRQFASSRTRDSKMNRQIYLMAEFLGLLRWNRLGDHLGTVYEGALRPKVVQLNRGLRAANANGLTNIVTEIAKQIEAEGCEVMFHDDGWVTIRSIDVARKHQVNRLIAARREARKAKNWVESDRIRDELAAMGIAIKDNKDGTTSWEVKR